MDERFYVYVLYKPWSGEPCYVGKGQGDRIEEHFRLARRKRHYNRHLQNIILKAGGDLPREVYADGLSNEEAFELERSLIARFGRKDRGGSLVNLTDGGDGHTGMSAEVRATISDKLTGRKLSADHVKATSEGMRASEKVASHIADLADWRRGRPLSQEHCQNIRKPVPADVVARRYMGGESMKEIADSFGVTETLVADRLDELGVPRRTRSEACVLRERRKRERLHAA